jgi:hypothetical protein
MFKITKSQVMHLLAVPITALAGLLTSYVSRILPVHIDLTATFITGAGAGLSLLIHYLHGWQVWERLSAGLGLSVVDDAPPPPPAVRKHTRKSPSA